MQGLRLMRVLGLTAASKPSHASVPLLGTACEGSDRDSQLLALLEAQAPVGAVLHLLKAGADATAISTIGESALHLAVAAGDTSLTHVGALLDFDADPDVRASRDGLTALHRALCGAHCGCTLLLLRAGANPDASVVLTPPSEPVKSAASKKRFHPSRPLFMAQLHNDIIAHSLSSCLVLVGGADVLERDPATGKVPAVTSAERGLHATTRFLSAHQRVAHPVRANAGDAAERSLLLSLERDVGCSEAESV